MRATRCRPQFQVWEGMWHVFHALFEVVPESREAIKKIGAFAREALSVELAS
jgi:acetyl esterase/lipase